MTMDKIFSICIVADINLDSCRYILQAIESDKESIYLLCGGLGACTEVVRAVNRGAGIVKIHDDDYIIKLLKHHSLYSSGRWIWVEGVCIAGIDAKNPIQNIESVLKSVPKNCELYLVFSVYRLPGSKCEKSTIMGKELDIGLPKDLAIKLLSSIERPLVYISCSELTPNVCVHAFEENLVYVAVSKSSQLVWLKICKRDTKLSVSVHKIIGT